MNDNINIQSFCFVPAKLENLEGDIPMSKVILFSDGNPFMLARVFVSSEFRRSEWHLICLTSGMCWSICPLIIIANNDLFPRKSVPGWVIKQYMMNPSENWFDLSEKSR